MSIIPVTLLLQFPRRPSWSVFHGDQTGVNDQWPHPLPCGLLNLRAGDITIQWTALTSRFCSSSVAQYRHVSRLNYLILQQNKCFYCFKDFVQDTIKCLHCVLTWDHIHLIKRWFFMQPWHFKGPATQNKQWGEGVENEEIRVKNGGLAAPEWICNQNPPFILHRFRMKPTSLCSCLSSSQVSVETRQKCSRMPFRLRWLFASGLFSTMCTQTLRHSLLKLQNHMVC